MLKDDDNRDDEEQVPPATQSKLPGYFTVAGGLAIHLFCGCLYLWGSIQNYVLSFYHNVEHDGAVTPEMVSLVLTLSIFSQSLTSYFGAWLYKRVHPRLVLTLGSTIMLGAMLGASFCTSWWPFVFCYAVLFPLGIGIVYWVPICCGWEWFPDKRGAVAGAVVAGYGLGAFFFGFLTTAIANPHNIRPHTKKKDGDTYFPNEVARNVPRMIRISLCFWVVLCAIGILSVQRNPVYVEEEKRRKRAELLKKQEASQQHNTQEMAQLLGPVGDQQTPQTTVRIDEQPEAEDERNFLTFREGLRHPRFYHITLMLFLGIFYGIYMAAVYKKTAQDYLDDDILTLAGAIGSICNGCSRYLWASLQDHYGFRRVYFVVMVIQLAISATIWNVRTNPHLYPVWVALSFLCEGAHFSQYPALSSKVFGVQYAGEIFTIIFMVIPASSALSYLLVQFGKDSVSPQSIFWIAAAFSAANIVLTYFLDETPIRGGGKKGKDAKSFATSFKGDDNGGRIQARSTLRGDDGRGAQA